MYFISISHEEEGRKVKTYQAAWWSLKLLAITTAERGGMRRGERGKEGDGDAD